MIIIQGWERFRELFYYHKELQLALDISRMKFYPEYFREMEHAMKGVFSGLAELEKGAIANPDENRMVGHYWLRNPQLAPRLELTQEIEDTWEEILAFVEKVHQGKLLGEKGKVFRNYLLIGIGGSSLGPRFLRTALSSSQDKLKGYFIDNTDPDGMDQILEEIGNELDQTLCLVVSKSGGTIETYNGMLEVQSIYREQGLNFGRHAVAITEKGSKLDLLSQRGNWLKVFPMWDWVGGRTSVFSAVGLLPLALQGIPIQSFLDGARKCDEETRRQDYRVNPGAILALMWYYATQGQGGKEMVVLPYKDRLELLGKYLQQLIMESLGKEKNLQGETVHQGLTVYGNKGSTDQHSYLQQLLEGPNNFFVTFIEVLKDRNKKSPLIGENSTSGDYLQAMLLGTRDALSQKGRESITITIPEVSPYSLGVLIALFERAVSIYALLVGLNPYHQPAVEMGKKVAREVISLKNQIQDLLMSQEGVSFTIEEIAAQIREEGNEEKVFRILWHLVSNPDHQVEVEENEDIFKRRFYFKGS
ncbi:MAG: glucose-6-phosphate isomerase [Desulfitobacterium sp.]|nr:glucose-6-phosphate isomerase [Desulfitobacterium sp.]